MKTILLADDELNLRTLVRTTLEGPDVRFLEAEHGLAALELARSETPDVVVLDWMMPGMSGLDVLRALRSDPATASLPVILLTARGQHADRQQAVEAGASAYLVKPFSPLELLEKVEAIGRETAATIAGARAQRAPEPAVLDAARDTQLALYARDLQRMFEAERMRAQELGEANARLRILDRLKSDFLAFISHELRTPLGHLSALDLYDPAADPAEQAEVMSIIRAGYERLDGFVRKGLDYFDWVGREPAVAEAACDVTAVVRGVLAHLPALAGCAVEDDGSSRACVGAEGLAVVARVLLENACKFARGEPVVAVVVRRDGDAVRLEVRDRGRGFPMELAEELFRPFTVADAAHHSEGSGLSLALARAIVEAHGGTITASSAGAGQGACFAVRLPAAPTAASHDYAQA